MIVYDSQSSKFNSHNVLLSSNLENFSLENYPLYGIHNSLHPYYSWDICVCICTDTEHDLLQEICNSERDSAESVEIEDISDINNVGINSEKGTRVQNIDINTGMSYSVVTSVSFYV